jgi:hypothetical protein
VWGGAGPNERRELAARGLSAGASHGWAVRYAMVSRPERRDTIELRDGPISAGMTRVNRGDSKPGVAVIQWVIRPCLTTPFLLAL